MPDNHFHGQVPVGEDDRMKQPHTLPAPQTPEVLNVVITPEHGRILDGHSEYRNQVKIRVDVERVGSSYKELALGDLPSMQRLGNYLPDTSQVLLSATASCASCTMTPAADIGQRCDPHTFSLTPSKAGAFLLLADCNARYSKVATFKIPFRYRSPSPGQWSRCSAESLIISFALEDHSFGTVATFQLQTPLRIRRHEKSQSQHVPVQPQHAPVQPNLLALPQASSGFGIDTTVLPPPPPSPHIVDINPIYGPHSTSQRVWVRVQNLPRGNGEQYAIDFGQVGMVATSFVSEEGDQVQILECTTPILPTPCISCPELRHSHDPQTPIGSSQAIYRFY